MRPAQPVGDGSVVSVLEEEDVSEVLWYISQRWLNLANICPLAYVVIVVSKADEDESKEDSDLVFLAYISDDERSQDSRRSSRQVGRAVIDTNRSKATTHLGRVSFTAEFGVRTSNKYALRRRVSVDQ
jgi:hypothetical protein